MTAQSHLLDRLSELDPADRAWILNQLSGRERAALMEAARSGSDTAMNGEPSPKNARAAIPPRSADAVPPSAATLRLMNDQIALVQTFSAEQVAYVLRGEPAWIIAGILSIESWRWSRALIEQLPAHVRIEVLRLRDKPLVIADGMRAALLASCAQRFAQSEVPKKSSRLRGVVQRMQAKLLSRRLSLRL